MALSLSPGAGGGCGPWLLWSAPVPPPEGAPPFTVSCGGCAPAPPRRACGARPQTPDGLEGRAGGAAFARRPQTLEGWAWAAFAFRPQTPDGLAAFSCSASTCWFHSRLDACQPSSSWPRRQ
ncbi:hypothetical protein FRZ00_29535 [Streptomyces mobaraensis]|uniref:Uncharacterized protein n=1 Tax=Streptomyces mobaraensis TaxID=35621 RepID=A0A5N5W067_STRMB|nr:hypothetical protein FRZ00_29535 [Streptomyces mobaraensis]